MSERPQVPVPREQASGEADGLVPDRLTPYGGMARVGWTLVPVVSCGFLAWVPFTRYAALTRSRFQAFVAAGYGVVAALAATLAALGERTGGAAGVLIVFLAIPGAVHANVLYRRRFRRRTDLSAAAYRQAKRSRRRRTKARRILASDPAMARELRIGRPDLPRDYDDGGLVDVNHVPADVLEQCLGWTAAEAGSVAHAREQIGGFSGAGELPAYAEVSQARVDAVSELLVFDLT